MQLEVGKRYRTRDGRVVHIIGYNPVDKWPWNGTFEDISRGIFSWDNTGNFTLPQKKHHTDLVEEIPTMNTQTPDRNAHIDAIVSRLRCCSAGKTAVRDILERCDVITEDNVRYQLHNLMRVSPETGWLIFSVVGETYTAHSASILTSKLFAACNWTGTMAELLAPPAAAPRQYGFTTGEPKPGMPQVILRQDGTGVVEVCLQYHEADGGDYKYLLNLNNYGIVRCVQYGPAIGHPAFEGENENQVIKIVK